MNEIWSASPWAESNRFQFWIISQSRQSQNHSRCIRKSDDEWINERCNGNSPIQQSKTNTAHIGNWLTAISLKLISILRNRSQCKYRLVCLYSSSQPSMIRMLLFGLIDRSDSRRIYRHSTGYYGEWLARNKSRFNVFEGGGGRRWCDGAAL